MASLKSDYNRDATQDMSLNTRLVTHLKAQILAQRLVKPLPKWIERWLHSRSLESEQEWSRYRKIEKWDLETEKKYKAVRMIMMYLECNKCLWCHEGLCFPGLGCNAVRYMRLSVPRGK